jgi:L-histidine N-alpha-methyltransferase
VDRNSTQGNTPGVLNRRRTAYVDRVTVRELTTPLTLRAQLTLDVAEGFTQTPKTLPPKYFYDVAGSGIFEKITELPEYYVTRAETSALVAFADEIVAAGTWSRLLELGSGSSTKTRTLLEALHRRVGGRITYAPLDISPSALDAAAASLVSWAEWLEVEGCVVDFLLPDFDAALTADAPQLGIMLGSTLGNLFDDQRGALLRSIANSMGVDDAFLFGIDLIKDASIIEPAYNDAAGVTEEFNKNVIRVLQRELGCTCGPDDFRHHAPYVADFERIEMRLHANRPLSIGFGAGELPGFQMKRDEYILTEISRKFERSSFTATVGAAGLAVEGWWTDPNKLVALAMLRLA